MSLNGILSWVNVFIHRKIPVLSVDQVDQYYEMHTGQWEQSHYSYNVFNDSLTCKSGFYPC